MPIIQADVALSDKNPHIIVARPTTGVAQKVSEVLSRQVIDFLLILFLLFLTYLFRVIERYEIQYEDLYIVHHDPSLRVGQWKIEDTIPDEYVKYPSVYPIIFILQYINLCQP